MRPNTVVIAWDDQGATTRSTLTGAVERLGVGDLALLLWRYGLLPRDQFDVLALMQRWNKRRQYRDLVSTMAAVGEERGCGRAMWEYDKSEDRYNYLYSADELKPIAEATRAASRKVEKSYPVGPNRTWVLRQIDLDVAGAVADVLHHAHVDDRHPAVLAAGVIDAAQGV